MVELAMTDGKKSLIQQTYEHFPYEEEPIVFSPNLIDLEDTRPDFYSSINKDAYKYCYRVFAEDEEDGAVKLGFYTETDEDKIEEIRQGISKVFAKIAEETKDYLEHKGA